MTFPHPPSPPPPPSRSTRKHHSLVFHTQSAWTDIYMCSFFPKTIIENGTPWQIPLFLLLSVQRIHLPGLLHRHSTEILRNCALVIKGNGSFWSYMVWTLGRFSPVLFLSGCIGLGRFSTISGVGCFGPLHFIQLL